MTYAEGATPADPPSDLDEFRVAARTWLGDNAERREHEPSAWGVGSDTVAVFHDGGDEIEAARCAAAVDWHRTKRAAGWALLTWPTELGGRDLPLVYEHVFAAEEARFRTPQPPEVVTITLSLVAPTVALFGSELQQQRLLPSLAELTTLCCQLFSEPSAGSDLASLSCRAERVPDGWRINGQKVWSSGARQATVGLLIARTDPNSPKHGGMTAFVLPLDVPGTEIRPIRQMTGGASFNEVFLTDVRIGDDCRLGEVGAGWKVARTMLGFERGVSGAGAGGVGGSWSRLLALARHLRSTEDPLMRQRLAQVYTHWRALEMMNDRTRGALIAGQEAGPLGSICKLFWTQHLTELSDVASGLLGPRLLADNGMWGMYAWAEHVLGAPGYRIAGGSDEIQRNIIAERVLGLPR